MTKTKKLAVRKQPSQVRSKLRVKRIISTTRKLLKLQGTSRLASISTNHIAKEAKIPVGSLYQYFPNKEAIFQALYSEMLEKILDVPKEFSQETYLALPREVFFEKLFIAFKAMEVKAGFDVDLSKAMMAYPVIVEMNKQHAEKISLEIAKLMKYHGSTWSMKKLHRLALFAYYNDYGTWIYRGLVDPNYREVLDWEIVTFTSIINQCFEN